MIYFISNGKNIKIGYTSGNPMRRLKTLQTGSSEKLTLVGYIEGTKKTERQLHTLFSNIRIDHSLEWFEGTQELLDYINEHSIYENIKAEIVDNKIIPCLNLSFNAF